jgi:epoxyqueuosine reductase
MTLNFEQVAECCAAEGLTALGIIAPVPQQLDATWIEKMERDGVGDMEWLLRTKVERTQPTHMLPNAHALIAVALSYQKEAGHGELQRARYAAGKDYHRLLRAKLARVGDRLSTLYGQPLSSRAAVDSAPLNERTLAQLAGLGWLGRNGLIISPTRGSFHVLGFLLTEIPLPPHHAGHGDDRCGTCTKCENACPTQALIDRRVQSTRCISYLTIEHKGVIPAHLAKHFNGWWFGCDICQTVCPWNRFAPGAQDERMRGHDDDQELLRITATTFDEHFAGRPIRRIGYERFRRNLLIALASLKRLDDCQPIIAEGLPLVLAQAQELGLLDANTGC